MRRSVMFAKLTLLAAAAILLYVNFHQQVNKNLGCDSFLDFLRRTQLSSDLFLIDRTFLAAIHSDDDNFQPCGKFGSTPVWFGLLNSTLISRFRSDIIRLPFDLDFDYFVLQTDKIHIGVVKVENFGKYWKIAKTPGDPPRAVLPFSLTKLSTKWLTANEDKLSLNIPADVDFFLWQLERSELLECYQTAAETPVINSEKFKLLPLARDIFYKSRKDAFLDGGTLLGWYRDCDVVADTTDLDLALKSTLYDSQFEAKLIREKRVKLVRMSGRANDSFQLQLTLNGIRLDLFLLYTLNSRESYICGMNVAKKSSVQFVLPPLKGICSAVLRQDLFFVPCNYPEFLTAYYGPQWYFFPFTNFYIDSPNNFRLLQRWTDAEWPKVFRTKFT